MAVYAEGRFDVLVAQALAHQQDRSIKSDEQGGVGVPEIVEPDRLHAGRLAALQHLLPEVVLRVREQPVVWLGLVEGGHVRLDVLA